MKIGDRVVMKKGRFPETKFRTGVVVNIGASWNDSLSIKRDNYRGHEYTWWDKHDWEILKS